MNRKTLRKKIKEIVYHESDMDKIMVLIQEEVRECLPEKCVRIRRSLTGRGYNICLSDMEKNLKQRGIL